MARRLPHAARALLLLGTLVALGGWWLARSPRSAEAPLQSGEDRAETRAEREREEPDSAPSNEPPTRSRQAIAEPPEPAAAATPKPEEPRLAPPEPETLEVIVRDEQGTRRAGVGLALLMRGDELVWGSNDPFRRTDEQGEARFPPDETEDMEFVMIDLPLDPPVYTRFAPGTRVELVVPPLGELRFELVDGDGRPRNLLSPQLSLNDQPVTGGRWTSVKQLPHIEPFPLATPYVFHWSSLGEWKPVQGEPQPPLTVDAPVRTHRVQLVDKHPVLVGRLLTPEGDPFRGEGLFTVFVDTAYRNHSVPADDEGRFRVQVDLETRPGARRFGRFRMISESGFLDHQCEVELPNALTAYENDIGDVRLSADPVMLTGEIRQGTRLVNARLEVFERASSSAEWTRSEAKTQGNGSGRFRVIGMPRPGYEYRIHVDRRWAQESDGHCEPGWEDFVIQLGEFARIEIVLSVKDPSRQKELEFLVERDNPPQLPPLPEGIDFRRLRGRIAPGTIDLVVRHNGTEIARRSDVVLVAEQTTAIELDLRAWL